MICPCQALARLRGRSLRGASSIREVWIEDEWVDIPEVCSASGRVRGLETVREDKVRGET